MIPLRLTLAPLALLLVAGVSPSQAAQSTYTKIVLEQCKDINPPTSEEEESENFLLRCKGHADYDIVFKESDLRQAVYYGYLDQKIVEEAFESFGHFNNMSGTVEWRLDDSGKAYATIMRFYLAGLDPETGDNDPSRTGQVLVISRVGQKEDGMGCVMGYVDAIANKDANDLARKVADDKASAFDCKTGKPEYVGNVTPDVVDQPMTNLPDYSK